MVKANFHTHSVYCDGHDTPEAVASYAYANGFTHLGFSGHMDPEIIMDVDAYYKKIREVQELYKGKMDILRGIEYDLLFHADCLYDAEYYIGTVHNIKVDGEKTMPIDYSPDRFQKLCHEYFSDDYYALAGVYYDMEAQLSDLAGCTFIGHFDLITRFNDQLHYVDEADPRYRSRALEAMEHLVSQGIPFEINCGAVNRKRKAQLYPNMDLLKNLHDMGGEIFINSDAHEKELLCGAFDQAVAAAKACGFTHTNILEHGADGKVVRRQVALDQFAVK